MRERNRAHYELQSAVGGNWKSINIFLCVFHARRLDYLERVIVLNASKNGMSRPINKFCTRCSFGSPKCEHEFWGEDCPQIIGDICGNDSSDELGGSW